MKHDNQARPQKQLLFLFRGDIKATSNPTWGTWRLPEVGGASCQRTVQVHADVRNPAGEAPQEGAGAEQRLQSVSEAAPHTNTRLPLAQHIPHNAVLPGLTFREPPPPLAAVPFESWSQESGQTNIWLQDGHMWPTCLLTPPGHWPLNYNSAVFSQNPKTSRTKFLQSGISSSEIHHRIVGGPAGEEKAFPPLPVIHVYTLSS